MVTFFLDRSGSADGGRSGGRTLIHRQPSLGNFAAAFLELYMVERGSYHVI